MHATDAPIARLELPDRTVPELRAGDILNTEKDSLPAYYLCAYRMPCFPIPSLASF
jgi:hypothetical protein